MTEVPQTAHEVRQQLIQAISEATDHSDLLRRLMAIAYPYGHAPPDRPDDSQRYWGD